MVRTALLYARCRRCSSRPAGCGSSDGGGSQVRPRSGSSCSRCSRRSSARAGAGPLARSRACARSPSRVAFDARRSTRGPFDDEARLLRPAAARPARTGPAASTTSACRSRPPRQPLMHGVVLLAIFGFCLAIALARRRPPAAARRARARRGRRLAGDARRRPGFGARRRSSSAACSSLLACGAAGGRRRALRPARRRRRACSCSPRSAATSSPAVAKGEFLSLAGAGTRTTSPTSPVGVRYVWDANYDGIHFPKKPTMVLTVDGAAALRLLARDDARRRSRATTGSRTLSGIATTSRADPQLPRDPLLPARARATERLAASRRDGRGAPRPRTCPGRAPGRLRPARHRRRSSIGSAASPSSPDGAARGTTATRSGATRRGRRPVQLARSRRRRRSGTRPRSRYLEIAPGAAVPPFGDRTGRERRSGRCSQHPVFGPSCGRTLPLYRRRAASSRRAPRTPYAAVVDARGVVPLGGRASRTTSSRRASRACRRSSTSSLRDEARLLPALRRRDGADAPLARASRPASPSGSRAATYDDDEGALDGHRPRRARLGRGLVRRLGLAAVRPDAGPRPARRARTTTASAELRRTERAARSEPGPRRRPPGFSVLGELAAQPRPGHDRRTGRDVPGDILAAPAQPRDRREPAEAARRARRSASVALIAVAKLVVRRGRAT